MMVEELNELFASTFIVESMGCIPIPELLALGSTSEESNQIEEKLQDY